MTLIELLIAYRDAVRSHGRQYADSWLQGTCDETLWEHITSSVDDAGMFLQADGRKMPSPLS